MRSLKIILLISIATVVAAVAAENQFHKVSATGFSARSGDTIMIVDTDQALQRGQEKFIPLMVWLGGKEHKTIYAGRDSFTLIGPDGISHAMPSFNELVKGYSSGLVHADYSRIKAERSYYEYARMYYLDCRPLWTVSFFPDPGSTRVLYDKVEVPSRTFFRALLYFPNPAPAKGGAYKLVYDDAKSGTQITVPFALNWAK